MSASVDSGRLGDPAPLFSLLGEANHERLFAWRKGRGISVRAFLGDVARAAALLPASGSAINLCEDRYSFVVSYCAAASRGHATLLPSSRAIQAIAEVRSAYPGAYLLGDQQACATHADMIRLPEFDIDDRHTALAGLPIEVGAAQVAAIGFTSGSTGLPKPNIKTWQNFRLGSRLNIEVLSRVLGLTDGQTASVLATVPAQHMYGMELSVLLPLFGPFSVHSGRPFFPADIACELASLPAPRVLVTTPVHLQALLRESQALPPLAAIVCATAPLSRELAQAVESKYQAPLIEMFGSTETCVIAHRRTASESDWQTHPSVVLSPHAEGTLVTADHLCAPVQLQDIVELHGSGRFRLCGRNADLLEIGGKRASLADLTRRLQSIDGVDDAVVFQLDAEPGSEVRRIAALAVAPGRSQRDLLARLREAVDPLFLPRPLRLVASLPRNETGKLPRAALLAALGAEQS